MFGIHIDKKYVGNINPNMRLQALAIYIGIQYRHRAYCESQIKVPYSRTILRPVEFGFVTAWVVFSGLVLAKNVQMVT